MEPHSKGLYSHLGLTHQYDDLAPGDRSGVPTDPDQEKGEISGRELDFIDDLLEDDEPEISIKPTRQKSNDEVLMAQSTN